MTLTSYHLLKMKNICPAVRTLLLFESKGIPMNSETLNSDLAIWKRNHTTPTYSMETYGLNRSRTSNFTLGAGRIFHICSAASSYVAWFPDSNSLGNFQDRAVFWIHMRTR